MFYPKFERALEVHKEDLKKNSNAVIDLQGDELDERVDTWSKGARKFFLYTIPLLFARLGFGYAQNYEANLQNFAVRIMSDIKNKIKEHSLLEAELQKTIDNDVERRGDIPGIEDGEQDPRVFEKEVARRNENIDESIRINKDILIQIREERDNFQKMMEYV